MPEAAPVAAVAVPGAVTPVLPLPERPAGVALPLDRRTGRLLSGDTRSGVALPSPAVSSLSDTYPSEVLSESEFLAWADGGILNAALPVVADSRARRFTMYEYLACFRRVLMSRHLATDPRVIM